MSLEDDSSTPKKRGRKRTVPDITSPDSSDFHSTRPKKVLKLTELSTLTSSGPFTGEKSPLASPKSMKKSSEISTFNTLYSSLKHKKPWSIKYKRINLPTADEKTHVPSDAELCDVLLQLTGLVKEEKIMPFLQTLYPGYPILTECKSNFLLEISRLSQE